MSSIRPFVRDEDEFVVGHPIHDYIEQHAQYLHTNTGEDIEVCRDYVKKASSEGGRFPLHDPECVFTARKGNGDRAIKKAPLTGFIKAARSKGRIMTPSLAVYDSPEDNPSQHAGFINEGLAVRSKMKKGMFEAERAGDTEKANLLDSGQAAQKKNNNAYSGATNSKGTILYWASTHSSLTSICRSGTSYANAANEKFILGNRHYYHLEIVKANITSMLQQLNRHELREVINEFNLHIPTAEEMFEVVVYSTKYYIGTLTQQKEQLIAFFERLPEEIRVAFVYCGDLYQLHQYNPELVINLLTEMSYKSETSNGPVSKEYFNQLDAPQKEMVIYMHHQEVRHYNLDKLDTEAPDLVGKIDATSQQFIKTITKYSNLLRVLFANDTVPTMVHSFPDMRRRAVPVSDTDSTIFSVAYWVKAVCEAHGRMDEWMKEFGYNINFAMVYLISGNVFHLLARFSKQMGVTGDKIHLLKMKSEFSFPVLIATTSAKHYCALQAAKEGTFYNEPKDEIKGVGLRDSKVPVDISAWAKKLMVDIMKEIADKGTVEILPYVKRIADMERGIHDSLRGGEPTYTVGVTVKTEDTYDKPMSSVYFHYPMWESIFAPKYGHSPKPTYNGLKLNLSIRNKTAMKQWIADIEDRALAERLETFMRENNKSKFETIIVPTDVINEVGMPSEITRVIDTRRTISTLMNAAYLIMESFGFMMRTKNNLRLFSDIY